MSLGDKWQANQSNYLWDAIPNFTKSWWAASILTNKSSGAPLPISWNIVEWSKKDWKGSWKQEFNQ